MKIGLLSYRSNPFSGGQGIYVKHLSSALAKLGHQVDVISGPPYPELHKEVNLIKIPSLDLFELEDNLRLRSFKLSFSAVFLKILKYFIVSDSMGGKHIKPITLSDNFFVQ